MHFKGWRPDSSVTFPNELEPVYASNADGRRWVRRRDIPGHFDATFYEAVRLWTMWKRFGLPHGRGWLAESEGVFQLITIVDEEWSLYESKEHEARIKERGNSGRVKGSRSR